MSAEEAITDTELEITPADTDSELEAGGAAEETPTPEDVLEDHSFILSDDGASESDTKKQIAAFATMRVKLKKAKDEAALLRAAPPSSEGAPEPPNADDYLSDVAVDTQYNGDVERARNAFLVAQSQHGQALQGFNDLKSKEAKQRITQLDRTARAQERFIEESQQWNIPGYEQHIETAETLLAANADELKRAFPEQAPLLLAHLGANPHKIDQFNSAAVTDPIVAFAEIATLANTLYSKAKEKKPKKVSTAPSETAPQPDATGVASLDDLTKRMQKAADAGNTEQYRALKQQKRNMERAVATS